MMRELIVRLNDFALEAVLILTVLAVPVYMNLGDVRIFEPDKAILLRDLASVLGVLALLHLFLHALSYLSIDLQRMQRRAGAKATTDASRQLLTVTGLFADRPTLLPLLVLAGVTLLATATSILPAVSWAGSYARGQGTLTTLAYLTVALAALAVIRCTAQVQRLGSAIALSGVLPAAYGWVQHTGHDPLPWQQADLTTRVPGTLGNPIFLGALLVMTIPLVLWRLALAVSAFERHGVRQLLAISGWALVLVVQAGALMFTGSRGPFAGLIVAVVVFGLALGRAWSLRLLRRLAATAGLAVALGLLAINVLPSGHGSSGTLSRLLHWAPQSSETSEVRLLIWGPALRLVAERPLLGCGPDTLLSCYYPVYPTALRHIEAPNAVPDRTHDILLDAAAETGLLGLAALLALLGTSAVTLWRLTRHAVHPAIRALSAALLATLVGHVAEGLFGISIVATALLTWLIAALASALVAIEVATARQVDWPATAIAATSWPLAPRGWRTLLPAWPFAVAAFVPADVPRRDLGARAPAHGASVVPVQAPARRAGPKSRRRAWTTQHPRTFAVATGLAFLACSGVMVLAIVAGATAMAADAAARQGADLSAAAQGNSGQTPLPAGLIARPILGLRQFAAAAQAQADAIAHEPDQEEYRLDAGTTMVAWADAAAAVGGPALDQAPALYSRALLLFGDAARLNPYDPDPLRDTGKAYERWAGLGKTPGAPQTWDQTLLSRAAAAFARAAQLAPHHPDPLTSGAQVALWQGQPQQALDLVARALALDPRDGDAYRLRGDAEMALGENGAALADWRRGLSDPTNSQRGPTAAHLAVAEATWAHNRCAALHDARVASAAGGLNATDALHVAEILRVDTTACSFP